MRTAPRPLLIAAVLTGATLASACSGTGDGPDAASAVATGDVAVVDNDFEPAAIEIEPGDSVTWTWEGGNDHDVVGDDFRSEVQRTGTFTHTFDAAGQYPYVCRLHGGMRGVVVVAGT